MTEKMLARFKRKRTENLRRLKRELYAAEHVRFVIQYQWRNPDGCVGDPMDWRSWRLFACLPILFHTSDEAWEYINTADIFGWTKGLKKVSCSVERVLI